MLPTTAVAPVPYTVGTPGTVVAVRVLAWLQVAALAVLGLIGLGLAAFSSAGLSAGGEGAAWASLGVALGLVWAGLCLLVLSAVFVPTVMLRAGRPAAVIALAVVEGTFALLTLAGSVAAVGSNGVASGLFGLLVAAWCGVTAVLALQPASRAWAARR